MYTREICVTPTLSVPRAVVAEHTCTCAYIYGHAVYVHKHACTQMRHVHVHGYTHCVGLVSNKHETCTLWWLMYICLTLPSFECRSRPSQLS